MKNKLLTFVINKFDLKHPFLIVFLVLGLYVANAQNKSQSLVVSGTIVDDNNLPLFGVTALEKGTSNGTVADIDGFFYFKVSSKEATLIFSYTGFKSKELKVSSVEDALKIKVVLSEETSKLEEVVLVGYGEESKTLQTSSVASLKAKDVTSIPTAQLSTSLAGRLPGVNIIQNSGFVGGSASISVRGSSTPALFVIDNIISDKAQFDALDPSEVESVSVLKDAAAAAIYGARASGGVLLVKTKSGKLSNKINVNYRGITTGYNLITPLQDWTPEQELIYINSVAYNLNRVSETPNPNFAPPYNKEALEYAKKNMNYQDLNDILWRSPSSQQHSVNVSGGSEKVRYFFSGNYNSNKGSYDKTNFDKYTLRAKVDAQISKNFKIGTNINYNRRVTSRFYWPFDRDNGEGFTVADFYRPTFNLSRLYPYYALADGTPVNYGTPGAIPVIKNWHFHPGETVNSKNYRDIRYNTFNAILNAELKIPQVEGLSLKFLGNYRQDGGFKKDFVGEFNRAYFVQTVGGSGIDLLKLAPLKLNDEHRALENYGRSFTGIDETFVFTERYQANGFIKYKRTFKNHYVNSFLGVEQSQLVSRYVNGTASELLTKNNDQILGANSSTDRRYFNGSELYQARLSYFGNLKYSYKDKYLAAFSFRSDGSYIFAKNNHFGFFPSFSAGWLVSKEDFFEPIKHIVSQLKLRASYGSTGYDGMNGTETKIAPYQYQNNYTPSGSYAFENKTSQALSPQSRVPNPNITWATNSTVDVGFDIRFLEDKLTLSYDYYTTDRTGVLVSSLSAIPDTFGSALPETNIGEQRVYGMDLAINYQDKIGADILYAVGLNLGYTKDEYVKWPQAEGIPDYQKIIGLPTTGVVRGYISEGIIREQSVIDNLPKGYTQHGQKLQLGNVLIKDINGDNYSSGPDGKVDVNDQTIISENAAPRLNYGIPINFEWKNLSLNIFLQGVGPYDKFVSTINTTNQGGVFQYGNRPYFQLWTEAYSQEYNPNGKYPAVMNKWTDPTYSGSATTFWKRNGAYMRLKNLNIAYKLPKKLLQPLGVSLLQINFNATNLFTLTSFDEYDPEQSTIDSYPLFKTYSIGLSLSF